MYNMKPAIEEAFRERGLRCTPQRYGVMEYLMRHPVHATAEQIYAAVNRVRPHMSRASVYNNLNALIEAGLVRQVVLEGGAARFDANISPHHHFVCETCGAVEDIQWFDIPRLASRAPLEGRSVRAYALVIRGACRACAARQE